jgi:hypothetical protein
MVTYSQETEHNFQLPVDMLRKIERLQEDSRAKHGLLLHMMADFVHSMSPYQLHKRINYFLIRLGDCCVLQLFVLYEVIMMIAKETTC